MGSIGHTQSIQAVPGNWTCPRLRKQKQEIHTNGVMETAGARSCSIVQVIRLVQVLLQRLKTTEGLKVGRATQGKLWSANGERPRELEKDKSSMKWIGETVSIWSLPPPLP